MGAPSWNSRGLRRTGLAGALAGGLTLMVSGVQGLAAVDDRLQSASEPSRATLILQHERRDHDCPFRKHRNRERDRL